MNIVEISIKDIFSIWSKFLWPNRLDIESTSAIKYGVLPYEYDLTYVSEQCSAFGVYENSVLVGVNSVHRTGESFRSRGLYVIPECRGKSIGRLLLEKSKDHANKNGAVYIWTMPRAAALKTYEAAGFKKTSDWFGTETNDKNCFAKCTLSGESDAGS